MLEIHVIYSRNPVIYSDNRQRDTGHWTAGPESEGGSDPRHNSPGDVHRQAG